MNYDEESKEQEYENYEKNDKEEYEEQEETEETIQEEKQKIFPDDYWEYDQEQAIKVLRAFPEQIREGYNLGKIILKKPINKIIIAGMGGSGITGDLTKIILRDKPIRTEVIKDYEVPKWVDEETLIIAVSYSGNTEETIAAYKEATRKGAEAVIISSGGKLAEIAKTNNHHHIKIPSGYQPRMALGYLFFPILRLLETNKIIEPQETAVNNLINILRKTNLYPKAIELSEKIKGKTPIIWSAKWFSPIAYRWKTQINENAKAPAFWHELSELNHNEILGFKNKNSDYIIIILSTDEDHHRIKKRITITKEILQKQGIPTIELGIKGGLLNKIFTTIHLGDLTSYFLALRLETDPTPVTTIEELKKQLGPYIG